MRSPDPLHVAPAVLRSLAVVGLLVIALPCQGAGTIRVKDLGKLKGWRDNALVGYGIVTGLAGTGDSPTNRSTRQAISNVLSRFNLVVPADQIQSRNVALVLVSASLPPFAREGDGVDVTVTSAGDARSLLGGSLLLTPLSGPDGRVHALAQGALSVGGYRYDANGNVVQKNHPTVGSIPNGATVELEVGSELLGEDEKLTFVLTAPDFSTANAIAVAINAQLGAGLARARDASGIEIAVPEGQRGDLVSFVARLENVGVEPDRRARVVIDERSGTVVAGGDVRISSVAISHGDLKVSVVNVNAVSQPVGAWQSGPGVRTALVTNTQIDVDDQSGGGLVTPGPTTIADLVQALAKLKVNTRDTISILRAIKAAGALHAELIVQ
jgi:flagellar P-ring protein FlgI